MNGLTRAVQLGLLAKEVAGLRLAGTKRREQRRQAVVTRLGLMHGLPQKIGQLLAFSELQESDGAFTALTESAPVMSPIEVRSELARRLKELDPPRTPEECFNKIAEDGAAASIGQVHRAWLRDGREVAVKLQYPDIGDTLAADLSALGWLTAPVGDLRKGFDVAAYRQEIGEMLRSELDYGLEAHAAVEFKRLVEADAGLCGRVVVPRVVSELSGPRLLVTEWIEGLAFPAYIKNHRLSAVPVAETLLRLFLRGLLDWRLLHADPNPGNYRFRADGTFGLLDFGCVKRVSPGLSDGMLEIMRAVAGGTAEVDGIWAAHERMGFDCRQLAAVRERLPELMQILFAPLNPSGPVKMQDWQVRDRVAALLGKDRMAYRLAGPPDSIYVVRAFQGMVQYLRELGADISWRRIFEEVTGCLSKADESGDLPGNAATEFRADADEEESMLSETLHILVTENGRQKVALKFRARAAENLPDLVPEDLRPQLASRGVDLDEIVGDLKRRSFAPGAVFHLIAEPRAVKVWLE